MKICNINRYKSKLIRHLFLILVLLIPIKSFGQTKCQLLFTQQANLENIFEMINKTFPQDYAESKSHAGTIKYNPWHWLNLLSLKLIDLDNTVGLFPDKMDFVITAKKKISGAQTTLKLAERFKGPFFKEFLKSYLKFLSVSDAEIRRIIDVVPEDKREVLRGFYKFLLELPEKLRQEPYRFNNDQIVYFTDLFNVVYSHSRAVRSPMDFITTLYYSLLQVENVRTQKNPEFTTDRINLVIAALSTNKDCGGCSSIRASLQGYLTNAGEERNKLLERIRSDIPHEKGFVEYGRDIELGPVPPRGYERPSDNPPSPL